MKKHKELNDEAVTLVTRTSEALMSIVAAILTVALAASAAAEEPTLRSDAVWLMSQNWRLTGIDEALARLNRTPAQVELGAAMGDGYSCGDGRIISVFREIREGECIDCMRLVFTDSSDQYALENVVVEYSATDGVVVTSYAKALLRAAGVSAVDIANIRRFLPLERLSFSWVSGTEYRAVELTIEAKKKSWSIHLSHLRQPITSP